MAYFVLALAMTLIDATGAVRAGELNDAVRANDSVAVEALLAGGAAVDELDPMMGQPLHVAVSQGNRDITEILINHGADLEAASALQGARALHLAAEFGDTAMVTLLLDGGAEIDSRDDENRTPLYRAAVGGHAETVGVLLDRGAMIDARENTKGQTALMQAALRGESDMVRLLVMRGADIHGADASGRTSFRLAASAESFANVGDGSLITYLAAQGADIDARESDGSTPLAWAENSSGRIAIYKEVARVLRQLGASR